MKTLYNMYNGTDASTQPPAAPAATSAVLGDKSMQSSAAVDEDPIAALDPELARYLNRDFWEQKQRERGAKTGTTKRQDHKSPSRKSPTPSAPPAAPAEPATPDLNDNKGAGCNVNSAAHNFPFTEPDAVTQLTATAANGYAKEHNDLQQTGDDPDDTDDTDSFAAQLKSQIETFVNRIRSDQVRF
jgi:growth factor-regulated tyrosine kinase substrate